MTSSLWIEDDTEVHPFGLALDQIRAMALDLDDCAGLISQVVERRQVEEESQRMPTDPNKHRALAWRKSRFSDGGNGCVEVASADVAPDSAPHKANRGPLVLIRD